MERETPFESVMTETLFEQVKILKKENDSLKIRLHNKEEEIKKYKDVLGWQRMKRSLDMPTPGACL